MFCCSYINVRFQVDFDLPAGYFLHLEDLWSVEHLFPRLGYHILETVLLCFLLFHWSFSLLTLLLFFLLLRLRFLRFRFHHLHQHLLLLINFLLLIIQLLTHNLHPLAFLLTRHNLPRAIFRGNIALLLLMSQKPMLLDDFLIQRYISAIIGS